LSTDRDTLKAAIHERLKTVNDPELHRSLVDLGMVKGCDVTDDNRAKLKIELTTPACPMKGKIREDIEGALRDLNLKGVDIEFTADVTKRAAAGLGEKKEVPGARNVLVVGAGKGGVGKSTVAVNLALALRQHGAKVGLLDADIYGPNVPLMMGISTRPEVKDDKIVPLEALGLQVMSIGFLLNEDTPVIWRGPMLHTAIGQFLFDVAWEGLDYLIVDLPPGTGDVQLSMSQRVPVTGAVVVATPSLAAIQDVRKAIQMFHTLKIPLLGVVENMSGEIFGTGEVEKMAERYKVPFLGSVPLDSRVRVGGDTGKPLQVTEPDSPISKTFHGIAANLAGQVSIVNYASQGEGLVQIKV
jgi:ATP-binding protein involved in chromosome partitioning